MVYFALFVNDLKCPTKNIVEKNFNKIQSRGPDNSTLQHTVVTPKINGIGKSLQPVPQHQWIGFHRLAINGLDSNSNQPLEPNDVVVICNGEIYNHVELNEEHGFKPTTKSDCEVILHMYQHYGVDFVNKLDGVFAFILYDKKNFKTNGCTRSYWCSTTILATPR